MQATNNIKTNNIKTKKPLENQLAIPQNIIFYILNYLNAQNIFNTGLTNSESHKNIIAYLKISSNNLLNLAIQSELDILNHLSKTNNIGTPYKDRETRKNLRFKYKKIKINTLPLIKLAIRNNINISYENLLKAIKITSVIHPYNSISDQLSSLRPFLLKMFQLFNNELTQADQIKINDKTFFKTAYGQPNSEYSNNSSICALLSPWPETDINTPYTVIKNLKWQNIKLMNYRKIIKWSKIFQNTSPYTLNLKKPFNHYLLSPTKLELIQKIYANQPNNHFKAFHNAINALLFISKEKLNLLYRENFVFISNLSLGILHKLIWREDLPYTITENSNTIRTIHNQWGCIDNYFNCCSAASVIITLCFPTNIKSNTYAKTVLVSDINLLKQNLLNHTTNNKIRKDKITKEKLIQFFVQNFPARYLAILEKTNTHENKLFEKINKENTNLITKDLINQFYYSKEPKKNNSENNSENKNENIFEYVF